MTIQVKRRGRPIINLDERGNYFYSDVGWIEQGSDPIRSTTFALHLRN